MIRMWQQALPHPRELYKSSRRRTLGRQSLRGRPCNQARLTIPSTFPGTRKRGPSDSVHQVPLKRARKAWSPAEEDITYSQIDRSKLQYRRSVLQPLSKDKPSVETWVEQTARTSREASVELGTPNIDRSSSVSVEEAALGTRLVTKTKITRPSASPFAAPISSVPTVDAAVTPRLVTHSKQRQHRPSASPFAQPKRKQQRTSQEEQTPFKRFVEAFNSLPGKATRGGCSQCLRMEK